MFWNTVPEYVHSASDDELSFLDELLQKFPVDFFRNLNSFLCKYDGLLIRFLCFSLQDLHRETS